MKFGILGPLTMHDNGVSYLPTAPKQRQLLALFLLNANRFVAIDAAVEELWEGNPPRTVIPTLQTYVLQIRRALAASPTLGSLTEAHKSLITGNRGYFLMVPPHSLDLMEWDQLVAEGREAQRRDDDAEMARKFRRALSLWRGPALGDVQAGPLLRAHVNRFEEARLSVTEQCFEAELRLGYHHDILSEIGDVAAQHPLNENLQAMYMLALYRAGRQVRALEVFRHLRRSVSDELGVEPSAQLRRLHEAILSADDRLEMTTHDQRFATTSRVSVR
ncbi:AfsR/SARP family transcriptional regulator [Lentzea sp. NPDC051208]|uniref:AfsR/SARP family transcriptional regulator n=1 Tax=Lentzea sp. NPDC051208 TaxID=3154642 RepID=UPI0034404C69